VRVKKNEQLPLWGHVIDKEGGGGRKLPSKGGKRAEAFPTCPPGLFVSGHHLWEFPLKTRNKGSKVQTC